MTPDDAREFIRHNHHAVLATRRRDGGTQMSPVAAVCDDDGRVLVSSRETAIKVHNLRREPRAWLCVLNDRFFGDWVQVEGPVVIESLPGALDALVRYYRLGFGEHPDWDDYRAAMEREKRVVIRLTIERAGPNVSG
jgi:PPOX class probable F420-dependent enzyme